MRVLLVEDDPLLGSGVRAGLEQAGVTADWTQDGEEAEAALSTTSYDAVVLDLGLPKMDGLSLLRRLRSRQNPVPVLVLTARGAVGDRVAGLDAGADDYLAKPFDLAELQARLRALLRRSKSVAAPVVRHGRVALEPATRTVTLDGERVGLLPREFATLEALLLNAGRVLSRAQLEDMLYGWDGEVESNAVEVYVHRLRRKLHPDLIRTVRGVGYLVPKGPA